VVLFSPLARDEVREIARHYLAKIEDTLRARKKTLVVDEDALEALVEEGHSLAYGARFLRRVIDERVRLPLSQHGATRRASTSRPRTARSCWRPAGPLALAYDGALTRFDPSAGHEPQRRQMSGAAS
jgi:hypothetical protein